MLPVSVVLYNRAPYSRQVECWFYLPVDCQLPVFQLPVIASTLCLVML